MGQVDAVNALDSGSGERLPGLPVLQVEGITKSFGGTRALSDVSFAVGKGEVHALLGGNGSGKSTLIKILAGVYQANEGSINVAGTRIDARQSTPGWAHGAGLRFVHQDMGTFADFSIAENFALGSSYGVPSLAPVNWRTLNARVQRTLDRFGVAASPRTLMGELRKSEQTLVAIARSLEDEQDSAVLVLDEPTAALPAQEVAQVHAAIRHYVELGHTVVMVSHRVDEVLDVCTHVTFLRDGRHLATEPISAMDERTIVMQIAGMDSVGRVARTVPAGGQPVLEMRGLSVGALTDVSLTVGRGEILGLSGLSGSGRSSLLRCIAGLNPRRDGEVLLDGQPLDPGMRPDQAIALGIAYLPEERGRDAAFPERPVRENLTAPRVRHFWSMGRVARAPERRAAMKAIIQYHIVTASTEAPFSSLSGGNQQKVVLARWLEMKPRLLLLDEPTQGVDVGARDVLHTLIRQAADAGVAVILASSDSRELSDISDRVIGLFNGCVSGEVRGATLDPQSCVELAYGMDRLDPIDTTAANQRGADADQDEQRG